MNRNETNAALRKSGDTPILDLDGALYAGATFKTSTGEMMISRDGEDPPVAAAADGVCKSTGLAHYVASQAETNVNVDFVAIFRQKARLNLGAKTTNCTTRIRAKLPGIGGNLFTLAWVQNGAVSPTTGTLTHSTSVDPVSGATLTNYVYTFKDGVSTTANFEATVAASSDLEVDVVGAGATLHTVDAFAAAALTGGLRDASVRQEILQVSTINTAIALAVGNAVVLGSYSRDEITNLLVGVMAGGSTDFTTNTIIFVCPVTGKTRLTVPLMTTGRGTPTIGDLS